jgi:hypothetical protein
MLRKLPHIQILIVLILLVSCKSETSEKVFLEKPILEGNWQVNNAYRNGAPTGTLDGAQFTFTPSLFSSNVPGFIFGENNVGEYSVSADTIYTGILRPSFFTVNYIDENSLSLSTLIQGYNFRFELERKDRNE